MNEGERRELADWMARLKDGDRAAFPLVYARVRPMIAAMARRALGNDADAEDVAQQALLSLFARAVEYDPERSPLSFIFGIAGYECLSARKRRERRREDPMPEVIGSGDPSPEDRAIERALLEAIDEVLGELAPRDREAIEAAIGRIARPSLPPPTFRKRLERALDRARARWRIKHGTE